MVSVKKATVILVISLFCFGNIGVAAQLNQKLEETYRLGQREFHKGNFQKALPAFESYLSLSKNGLNKKERLFWVIDQIGYIYLRVKKDPDGAIKFFKKFEADSRLNEAQQDAVSGWISVSNDWKKDKAKPSKIKDPNKLYKLGKKYFERGLAKKSYPMDDAGNADFAISETYLRPFIINYDKDAKIGEALLMMGRIKFNLKNDIDYWSESHYLKEVIRRFPNSKIAEVAWEKLNDDIRFGYTGSSGDNTPPSVVDMLARYKKMAKQIQPKMEKIK